MNMPPVVKGLLLANVIMFVIDSAIPLLGWDVDLSSVLGLYYFQQPLFRPWQPFTYMFMHASFSHIFFNMFALWMFGRIIEQVWGAKRFLIYYIVCGLGAAFVQELCQMIGLLYAGAMTIGASGAVYGILLAFGMIFPNERLFIIPIPFPIKAKYFVMAYAVIELIEGMVSSDGVAHFAHLGGMLFGLILILYWRNKSTRHYNLGSGRNFWTENSSSSYSRNEGNYGKSDEGFFSKLKKRFFGKSDPDVTVRYMNDRERDYEYNMRKKADNDEIDRILDKIRQSGYASLTAEEKQRLFDASNKK
ncbi:MAG: rhomboid family intramembrane serine protease [Bacteroidaceae bacterium]|nr:rhomboid family intramembrane serine protease [Bacteroidaceae bacterium]